MKLVAKADYPCIYGSTVVVRTEFFTFQKRKFMKYSRLSDHFDLAIHDHKPMKGIVNSQQKQTIVLGN